MATPSTSLSIGVKLKPREIEVELENGGATDLYLFDRLWKLGDTFAPEPEPHVYTYVRDGFVRFLLGAAPLPRIKCVTLRLIPDVSVLLPGKKVTRKLALTPFEREGVTTGEVREHSEYFPVTKETPWRKVEARRACVLVHYFESEERPAASPSRVFDDAFHLDRPVAMAQEAKVACSEPVSCTLTVMQREDEFERPTLPGEAPEPMVIT